MIVNMTAKIAKFLFLICFGKFKDIEQDTAKKLLFILCSKSFSCFLFHHFKEVVLSVQTVLQSTLIPIMVDGTLLLVTETC